MAKFWFWKELAGDFIRANGLICSIRTDEVSADYLEISSAWMEQSLIIEFWRWSRLYRVYRASNPGNPPLWHLLLLIHCIKHIFYILYISCQQLDVWDMRTSLQIPRNQGQGLFRNFALDRVYRHFIIHCIFIHCICVFVFCICMIDNSTYHFRHPCTLCFPKKTLGWLNAYCKLKPYIYFSRCHFINCIGLHW